MNQKTKITIEYHPTEPKNRTLLKCHEAYEAQQKEIKVGDWFLLTHSGVVRKWNEDDMDKSSNAYLHCTKLPQSAQDELNKFMDEVMYKKFEKPSEFKMKPYPVPNEDSFTKPLTGKEQRPTKAYNNTPKFCSND